MISAAVWVARGISKNVPEFYEPTEEEIAELVKKQEIALEMLDKEGDEDEDFDENERWGLSRFLTREICCHRFSWITREIIIIND